MEEVDLGRPTEGIRALTDRQRDILGGVVQGKMDKEIAADLGLSPKTVKAHLGVVYKKLGVHNRTQAAVAAVRDTIGP